VRWRWFGRRWRQPAADGGANSVTDPDKGGDSYANAYAGTDGYTHGIVLSLPDDESDRFIRTWGSYAGTVSLLCLLRRQ
jgi:hypothetical protein